MVTTSPFFEKEKILENEVGFVVYDGFPVSEGHCLIVPHRFYPDYFDSTEEEIIGLQNLVVQTKEYLDKKYKPNGYNVGINCGRLEDKQYLTFTFTLSRDMKVIWMIHEVGFEV